MIERLTRRDARGREYENAEATPFLDETESEAADDDREG